MPSSSRALLKAVSSSGVMHSKEWEVLGKSVYITPPTPPRDLRQTLALAYQASHIGDSSGKKPAPQTSRPGKPRKPAKTTPNPEDRRGMAYCSFYREPVSQQYSDRGFVVMSNTDTPLKREQERELALPRPHPLFFTSIGAGYAFGNDDLGVVTERDAENLQFSLTTDPEEEDESKQTLAWQRIGWETFTSLNPLRMKHIAQFIGLQPIEGVYSGQNPITSQRSARVFFSPAEENGDTPYHPPRKTKHTAIGSLFDEDTPEDAEGQDRAIASASWR